jgi:hypothetical protein
MKSNRMKPINTLLITLFLVTSLSMEGQLKNYDIFSYQAPKGFSLQKLDAALFYSKKDSKSYCQLFLYPATASVGTPEADFNANWNSFARNSGQGINDPETRETDTANGWHTIMGAARGKYGNKSFVLTLTTLSNGEISFYTASVFSDQKYLPAVQEFTGSIEPDLQLYTRKQKITDPSTPIQNQPVSQGGHAAITKSSTRFDDGWLATATSDYVKVVKENTEVRLMYINDALDQTRPNTVDATDYYWNQYVSPYFQITQTEKWSGVEYPVIYYMQGSGTDLATGKPCHVALKIVYSGGARPIMVISPDQQQLKQQYPHPNDLDRMLNYNKFALSAADITGKWTGGSGGGVEYYNAYTGTYAGMSAISTSDDFEFKSDGTYTSAYRSASSNMGATRFGAIDYKGKYHITDWSIRAENRYKGKTTLFNAQLIAVKNGFLLYLSDNDAPSMNYTLIKFK